MFIYDHASFKAFKLPVRITPLPVLQQNTAAGAMSSKSSTWLPGWYDTHMLRGSPAGGSILFSDKLSSAPLTFFHVQTTPVMAASHVASSASSPRKRSRPTSAGCHPQRTTARSTTTQRLPRCTCSLSVPWSSPHGSRPAHSAHSVSRILRM